VLIPVTEEKSIPKERGPKSLIVVLRTPASIALFLPVDAALAPAADAVDAQEPDADEPADAASKSEKAVSKKDALKKEPAKPKVPSRPRAASEERPPPRSPRTRRQKEAAKLPAPPTPPMLPNGWWLIPRTPNLPTPPSLGDIPSFERGGSETVEEYDVYNDPHSQLREAADYVLAMMAYAIASD
jgi:hypothetical protein